MDKNTNNELEILKKKLKERERLLESIKKNYVLLEKKLNPKLDELNKKTFEEIRDEVFNFADSNSHLKDYYKIIERYLFDKGISRTDIPVEHPLYNKIEKIKIALEIKLEKNKINSNPELEKLNSKSLEELKKDIFEFTNNNKDSLKKDRHWSRPYFIIEKYLQNKNINKGSIRFSDLDDKLSVIQQQLGEVLLKIFSEEINSTQFEELNKKTIEELQPEILEFMNEFCSKNRGFFNEYMVLEEYLKTKGIKDRHKIPYDTELYNKIEEIRNFLEEAMSEFNEKRESQYQKQLDKIKEDKEEIINNISKWAEEVGIRKVTYDDIRTKLEEIGFPIGKYVSFGKGTKDLRFLWLEINFKLKDLIKKRN